MTIPYNPHRDQPITIEVALTNTSEARLVATVRVTDEGILVDGYVDGTHADTFSLMWQELLPQMFE